MPNEHLPQIHAPEDAPSPLDTSASSPDADEIPHPITPAEVTPEQFVIQLANDAAEVRELHGAADYLLRSRSINTVVYSKEDLVQDVFLRLWKSRRKIDLSTSTRPLLWTIAARSTTDLWRKKVVRPVTTEPVEQVNPSDPLGPIEARAVLAQVLGKLTEDHRKILHERFLEGANVSETAEKLGIPKGTVKSRTAHALKNARHILTSEFGLSADDIFG